MELSNKTLNLLGDSITEGAGAGSPDSCYASLLQKSGVFAEVRNYGIGGTRVAPNRSASSDPKYDQDFCSRALSMEPADIIVVFGGTNDFGHGDAPFGELSDTTADTFCGAYHTLLHTLQTQYPGARPVVITPLHREGEDSVHGEGLKENGRILEEYVNAIKAIAAAHQVTVLDLFGNPPFPATEEFLADGLHPNDRGHALLAETILAFLRSFI